MTTERNAPLARRQALLRWTQRLLFITGILLLGYVGFTLLEARLYQVSAKRSLENEILVEKERPQTQPKTPVKKGDVLGRMDIPRLGMSVAVLQGTSSRVLRLGIGHIAGTPLPGEDGNVGIAGHRDTYFRALKDIQASDKIEIQTTEGITRYEVDWIQITVPSDVAIVSPTADSALTLVTCYPFHYIGAAPERFVVHAHRQ